MFEGSLVALVTPFKNGEVDYQKQKELIEFHIKNGTSGIVPCGTTGESATLSFEEHERVVGEVVRIVAGRIKVLAGTGSNNTAEALRLTKHAKKQGQMAPCLLHLTTISPHLKDSIGITNSLLKRWIFPS